MPRLNESDRIDRGPDCHPKGVRQFRDIKDPLHLSMGTVVSAVVVTQELIAANGGKKLPAVVIESAMPNMLVKVEQRFEQLIESFDRDGSTCEPSPRCSGSEELASVLALATTLTAFCAGGATVGILTMTFD